jgi:hypothetical protein
MGKDIEIKSRYDESKVLYVAKGAPDVRAAVEAAVASGANLGDANLRDANLRGANLGGAYLRDAYLGGANLGGANLRGANLRDAYLRGANLRDAYLRGANLRDANLRGAYLGDANLRDAYLGGANLGGANLGGAKGLNPYAVNDLLLLQHQVGKIRAYKLVTADGRGPIHGGLTYEVGKSVEVKKANCDESVQCGAGVNLATLPWCMKEWLPGHRILLAEFTARDIAAIPNGDGKFRVHRCKIVKELSLTEIGLVEKEEVA